MKFIFKCILGFLGVFWLTVSILKVASEVDEYIVSKKTKENKIEISKNISSKGDKFVDNNMEILKLVNVDIESLNVILSDGKINDSEIIKSRELIDKIVGNSEMLKNINQKKTFSNLDDFRAKVTEITNTADQYCNDFKLCMDTGEAINIETFTGMKKIISDSIIELTETVKTYEVN